MLEPISRVMRAMRLALLTISVSMFSACGGGDGIAPKLDPAQALWSISVDQRAVTISVVPPYDTIRLTAHAMSVGGARIDSVATVTFATQDSLVAVDTTGFVTAKFVGDSARVIVTARTSNATTQDTILINVTNDANPPHAASLDLSTAFGVDSVLQAGSFDPNRSFKELVVTAYDANSIPITGFAYKLRSADTMAVNIDYGAFFFDPLPVAYNYSAGSPKTVMLYAEATIYGVTVRDSMPIVLADPLFAFVTTEFRTPVSSSTPVGYFTRDSVVIAAGGAVTWTNLTTNPIDVVFDDSAAAQSYPFDDSGSGNIPAFRADSVGVSVNRARVFTNPGVYKYHSTLYGTTGQVVVRPAP